MSNPRKELSDRYKEQTLRVREIVNRHDPMGLMACGCPEDEYDPEVVRIVPLLDRCVDLVTFRAACVAVFVELFNQQSVDRFAGWEGLAVELWTQSEHTLN